MNHPVKIGVSACLLGEKVRYDGGHKYDAYIAETLGSRFTLVPVCPEVGCGLPVPREAMQLEGEPRAPRLVTIRTRIDLTAQMLAFCRRKVEELAMEGLCGFIFKKNSPSCGLSLVEVYGRGGAVDHGSGLFARGVAERFPSLPVVEEGSLGEPGVREGFLERVIAFRLRQD